jgi:Short C-terminal domain
LLALAWGSTALPATDAPRNAPLWTGDDEWVRIEPQDKSATVPNDQPVALDNGTVTRALSALRIRVVDPDNGTEVQRAVFTAEEVGHIAPYVTSGLAKAGPRQDITFSTIGSRARGVGSSVRDPSVNAGRIFYQGGKLNVIFGELQSNYRKKNVYGQRDQDFTPRRQGTREKESEQKLTLTAVPGVAFEAARNDWLTIDLAVAGAQAVATSPTSTTGAAAAPQAATRAPEPPRPTPQPAPSPATGAAPAPAPAAAPAAPTADSKTADLERRLRALKEMKDKGLITEEAYNAKMKELLSEL